MTVVYDIIIKIYRIFCVVLLFSLKIIFFKLKVMNQLI